MRGFRTGATVGLSLHMALFLILRAPLPAQSPAVAAIEIASSPAGAFVYLNGRILGKSPLVAEGLAPGLYEIELQKPGYVPKTVTVNAAGGSRYVVSVELEELSGFLELSAEPDGAEILVDGLPVPRGLMKLRAGTHKAAARLFGYETQERSVFVSPLFPQKESFALEPAPFRLSGLFATRSPFSPQNQGVLGTTRIVFAVSAPGSARLSVRDSSGAEVAAREFGSFDTWDQSFAWNGRKTDGSALPDGSYVAVLESTVPGGEPMSLCAPIEIDSSARIRVRSLATGSSGFLFSPDASILPRNGIEMRMGALFPMRSDASPTIVPLWPGMRMGLGSGLELSIGFPIAIGIAGSSVSASLKYQYLNRRAALGFEGAALILGSVGALPGHRPVRGNPWRHRRPPPHRLRRGNPGRVVLPVGLSHLRLRRLLRPDRGLRGPWDPGSRFRCPSISQRELQRTGLLPRLADQDRAGRPLPHSSPALLDRGRRGRLYRPGREPFPLRPSRHRDNLLGHG